jgi:hypothetical protein
VEAPGQAPKIVLSPLVCYPVVAAAMTVDLTGSLLILTKSAVQRCAKIGHLFSTRSRSVSVRLWITGAQTHHENEGARFGATSYDRDSPNMARQLSSLDLDVTLRAEKDNKWRHHRAD